MKLRAVTSAMLIFQLVGCNSTPNLVEQSQNTPNSNQNALIDRANKRIAKLETVAYNSTDKGASSIVQLAHNYFYGQNGFEQDYVKAHDYLMHHLYYDELHELPKTTDIMVSDKVGETTFRLKYTSHSRSGQLLNGYNYLLLAKIYEEGLGRRVDLDKAFKYYLLSAHEPISARVYNNRQLIMAKKEAEAKVEEIYRALYGEGSVNPSDLNIELMAKKANYQGIDDAMENMGSYHGLLSGSTKSTYIEMLVTADEDKPIVLTSVEVPACELQGNDNIFNELANHYTVLGDRLFLEVDRCTDTFHKIGNEVLLHTLDGTITLRATEHKKHWLAGGYNYIYQPVEQ